MTAPRHISEVLAEWIEADPERAIRLLASPTIGAWRKAERLARQYREAS